jgi:thymidylate synthase
MLVRDIRREFYIKLLRKELVGDTIELVGTSFIADEESIFGQVNMDYVSRELEWYGSMSLNVNDIPAPIPRIWQEVADSNGEINSNYGWAVFHPDNGNQYASVFNELETNPNSRRAIMIYTRPTMHTDYNSSGKSDFICTNTVHYMVRDGKLVAIVNMRSNDAVYGYKNDYQWQKFVHTKLADELGIPTGQMIWQANSLHVYSRHFNLVENYNGLE